MRLLERIILITCFLLLVNVLPESSFGSLKIDGINKRADDPSTKMKARRSEIQNAGYQKDTYSQKGNECEGKVQVKREKANVQYLTAFRELLDQLGSHQNSLPSTQQGGSKASVEEQNLQLISSPVVAQLSDGNEESTDSQLLQDLTSSFQESLPVLEQSGDEASRQQDPDLISDLSGPPQAAINEGTSEPQSRRNRRGRRPGTNQHPPWLPEGWCIARRRRENGITAGHVDKYYVCPDGKKFRSKREVEDYIRSTAASANQGQE